MIWNLWRRRALRRWAAYFKQLHAGVCSIREESTHNKMYCWFSSSSSSSSLWRGCGCHTFLDGISGSENCNDCKKNILCLDGLCAKHRQLCNDTEQKERKKKSSNQHGAKDRLLDCYRFWYWVVHHLYDLNKQKRFVLMLENVKLDETNLKSFCVIYSALLVLSHECGLADMKNHEEALS